MKKFIISTLLAVSVSMFAMEKVEKDKAPTAKKEDVMTAEKTAKSNDVTKSSSKKHSLLACLSCESEANKK